MAKQDTEDMRSRILDAFMAAVRAEGVDRASMGDVGKRVGLDRSTLYYYFKSKEQLIGETLALVTKGYVTQLREAIAAFPIAGRAKHLVAHLFGPKFHHPEFSPLLDEFNVAGNRDAKIERQVADIYRAVEHTIIEVIHASYPKSNPKLRRETAYCISLLAEGSSVFQALGFDSDRRLAAKVTSLRLLDMLEPGHRTAQRSVR